MTSEELQEIGLRIAQRRKELNLTQERVADLMDVSVQMVSNLERGVKAIKIDNLIKISEILGISTDYILTGKHTLNDHNIMLLKLTKLSDEDFDMIDMLTEYCLSKREHKKQGTSPCFLILPSHPLSYLLFPFRKIQPYSFRRMIPSLFCLSSQPYEINKINPVVARHVPTICIQ